MRRPAVATVLTAHSWEEEFISFIRDGAGLRVVTRAYEPEEVMRRAPDVVVVGSETSWISPTHVRAWKRRGIRVLGLHPLGDQPGKELLERGGADAILPETTSAVGLLRTVQALSVDRSRVLPDGALVAVTGPRGAPGRTELALALALGTTDRARTLIIDLDPPSIGLRLGLGPRPSLLEVLDRVRIKGTPLPVRRVDALSVLTGIEGGPLAPSLRWELIQAALDTHDLVIADLGPWPQNAAILRSATTAVLVCDASPTGMVRARSVVEDWIGPTPRVVVNRATAGEATRRMAREALGLEPELRVPYLEPVRKASLNNELPPARLVDRMADLGLSALIKQTSGDLVS